MTKYLKTRDRREFIDTAIEGLRFYLIEKKVSIAHMVLSQDNDSKKDLFRMFEMFCPRMLNFSKYGRFLRIDFNMAMVDNQHMHILIKKPYSPLDYLKRNWNEIVGKNSDFYIRPVKPTMADIERVVMYISQQEEHQGHKNISFIRNIQWGTMTKKEKEGINIIKIPDKVDIPEFQDMRGMIRDNNGEWVKSNGNSEHYKIPD